MGYIELIEALRMECDEKIHAVRQKAAAEAEKIRREAAKKIEEIKEEHSRVLTSMVKDETDTIIFEAEKKARTIRLLSEKGMSNRLYKHSASLLYNLKGKDYKDVFSAIVQELPQDKWETVRINPEDEYIAKEYFHDSLIIPDSSITGGLAVTTNDGGISILNTFEKRLERAWDQVLPEIIKEIGKL